MEATMESLRDAVRDMTASIDGFSEVLRTAATKEEVKESEDRQSHRLFWTRLLAGLAILLLAIPAGDSILIVNRVLANTEALRQNGIDGVVARTSIVECTTPSPGPGKGMAKDGSDDVHECYEDGNHRTEGAIGALTLNILDIAVCARIEKTPETILGCYQGRLAARSTPGPGAP